MSRRSRSRQWEQPRPRRELQTYEVVRQRADWFIAWQQRTLNSVTFGTMFGSTVGVIDALNTGSAAGGADLGLRLGLISATATFAIASGVMPLFDRLHEILDRMPQTFGVRLPELRRDPVINRRGRGRRTTRKGVQEQMEELTAKHRAPAPSQPRPRPLSLSQPRTAFASSVQPASGVVVKQSEMDVAQFYRVLIPMFEKHHDHLSRDAFGKEFKSDSQAYHAIYVGIRDRDLNRYNQNQRGLWRKWRIVEEKSGHGTCRFKPDLTIEDILRMNRRLARYAQRQGWSL